MCGIVGYIGPRDAAEILIEGLRRLEYRGYDSAGVATIDGRGFALTKTAGRVDDLVAAMAESPCPGSVGIGHTRWATHGPATEVNAHPHLSGDAAVAVVHNGVIENYRELKADLEEEGFLFQSSTDTEVIAQLITRELRVVQDRPGSQLSDRYQPLVDAVYAALAQVRGAYGLAILFRDWPDVILAAKMDSPLAIGVGEGENFIASHPAAFIGHTEKIVQLEDRELAVVTADDLRVVHSESGDVKHRVQVLELESQEVDLGVYEHYMLKEIFEQPESIRNAMRGRLDRREATAVFGGLNLPPRKLRRTGRILLTACGTSWHAALVGEYIFEALARIPVEVEYASELRYRNPPMDDNTLLFAITQSGETSDTLAAMMEMQRKGHPALAICNVVGSTISQRAIGGVYLHAGPEIGVASTKAYTSQCVVLAMLSLYFGRLQHLSFEQGLEIISQLEALPDQVAAALSANDEVRRIAEKYAGCNNFLYLGRQFNFPTALEGALKLKEISYIHAEGYPAAEMKHGPIALVDENTPSVFIIPHGAVYEKVMSNLEEIKARGGPVIAITADGDHQVAQLADDVIRVPPVVDYLQPIVTVLPLQLLAYHIAVFRGCDVDKPRNLAKSVTVE
jgi:glucosamine--fructose-6-phosphate aminotransferase (isomerizing)